MESWIVSLLDWYKATLDSGGYTLIALLMAMESTIIPIPSEVIIPPAALMVESGRFRAGRPLVLRYGKYILIPESKVILAEKWAAKFGSLGVFFSRLLPVVRHLIGLPAGIVRLNFVKYSIYTLIGSLIWTGILCFVGIKAGEDEALMRGDLQRVMYWALGAFVILGAMYYFLVHRQITSADEEKKSEEKSSNS